RRKASSERPRAFAWATRFASASGGSSSVIVILASFNIVPLSQCRGKYRQCQPAAYAAGLRYRFAWPEGRVRVGLRESAPPRRPPWGDEKGDQLPCCATVGAAFPPRDLQDRKWDLLSLVTQ